MNNNLPFPGWPPTWKLRLIGYLAALANSGGDRSRWGWRWYDVKDRVLQRWGRRDGWDLQVFECWGERYNQHGDTRCLPRDAAKDEEHLPDCSRCGGSGIFKAVELKRYRIDGATLHRPGRSNTGDWAVAGALLNWDRRLEGLGPPREKLVDRIRHTRRRGADLAFRLLLWMIGEKPRYRPSLWRRARAEVILYADQVRLTGLAAWAWWVRGYWVIRPSCYRLPTEPLTIRWASGVVTKWAPECPECSGPLGFEVEQHGVDGRIEPDQGDITVFCLSDPGDHRRWQSDWQWTIDRVSRWVAVRCRVFDCPLAEEPNCTPCDGIPF